MFKAYKEEDKVFCMNEECLNKIYPDEDLCDACADHMFHDMEQEYFHDASDIYVEVNAVQKQEFFDDVLF